MVAKRKRGEGLRFTVAMRWLIGGFLLAGVIGLTFIYWAAIGFSNASTEIHVTGEAAETYISEALHPVPDDATYAHFFYIRWQDSLMQLRFSAAAANVETWVEGLACDQWEHGNDARAIYHSANLDWWNPTSARDYTIAACAENPNFRVLVDQSDDEVWTVYIQYFTM